MGSLRVSGVLLVVVVDLKLVKMSSGFVTETELEEKKRVRQEEWGRVRKPEDPETAPEEPVDNRSLWERLNEQKQKKQDDWDEEHKFKNQFRGLNDEEVDFLDKIDNARADVERKKFLEEQQELEEFERMQQESRERELKERLELEKKVPRKAPVTAPSSGSSKRNSQLKLLAGAVKRKTASEDADIKKIKTQDKSEAPPGLLGLAAYGSDSDSGSE